MTSNREDSQSEVLEQKLAPESEKDNESTVNWQTPKKPMQAWRLWVPLLFQTALIAAVPAQSVYTYMTGKTVILQTAPVDPYNFLTGYYQTLSYDISLPNNLKKLPGWKELPGTIIPCQPEQVEIENCKEEKKIDAGISFYVILEKPKSSNYSGRPQPWKPVRVSIKRPSLLPENQVALKGKYNGWRIEYGLETYYIPEKERDRINNEISKAQQRQTEAPAQPQPFVVEIKVDERGYAVPVSFWVYNRNYRF
ncbi:MAG: GDYXXLXY domain-containing protein [Oscillatoriaceae bacterium SKW80]|nr:GDYXXLXY domain-containing protein [Oscillatoriaceae bacterium SKYG93]MCX8120733.1 GDYXXLXY domain-containing protein [Oscillatoriaceae bacterium SKW80]MDW8453729.1 GDYXXLXY domain-containing protein [Oscillatoriaceae cyanobacterium SKYGB_i_bin93]HIK26961.1 GDYXXLXY domain-containing protein [Oscillatoriaceae cyanobacterium M7585_C2015_266]